MGKTQRARGRPPRDVKVTQEWAETCILLQILYQADAKGMEEKLGNEDGSGRTWRSWCNAERTPTPRKRSNVLALLKWPEDPHQKEKHLRNAVIQAIKKAFVITEKWQEFSVLTGVNAGTSSDRLGAATGHLLDALASALENANDEEGFHAVEQACHDVC